MLKSFEMIKTNINYNVPKGWSRIRTIDMHTGGEPLRVIVNGLPKLEGKNILEFRQNFKRNNDLIRKLLMHEPRGHADMYGCILLPPNDDDADFGILFLHNEGYSTMCGHAIIAITKLAIIMGWVEAFEPKTMIKIDAPCGRITSFAKIEKNEVQSVYFHGVPSFVVALNRKIEIENLGTLSYDLAYGGAFYAYVNADALGLSLTSQNYSKLIEYGMAIKKAIIESDQKVRHPFEEDLSFLYGVIFISEPVSENVDSRNVCVFADGEVDRCPTGSGVSGRMAIHFARKEISIEETMTIESITGSIFTGSIVETTSFGPYEAVIPKVEGNAYITGQHEFVVDPQDPFKEGFFLR